MFSACPMPMRHGHTLFNNSARAHLPLARSYISLIPKSIGYTRISPSDFKAAKPMTASKSVMLAVLTSLGMHPRLRLAAASASLASAASRADLASDFLIGGCLQLVVLHLGLGGAGDVARRVDVVTVREHERLGRGARPGGRATPRRGN